MTPFSPSFMIAETAASVSYAGEATDQRPLEQTPLLLGLADDAKLVVPTADARVRVVSAQLHLAALGHHLAILVKACHAGCRATTPADRLDLFDHVCPGHQPKGPLKEIALEVSSQAIADDRHPERVNHIG